MERGCGGESFMPATCRLRKRFLTVCPDADGGESTPDELCIGGDVWRIAPIRVPTSGDP